MNVQFSSGGAGGSRFAHPHPRYARVSPPKGKPALRALRWFIAASLLAACGRPDASPAPEIDTNVAPDTGPDVANVATCPDAPMLPERGTTTLSGSGPCTIELLLPQPLILEVSTTDATLQGDESDESTWLSPRLVDPSDSLALEVDADGVWSVTIESHGPPVENVSRERSLVWTQPELVDDPQTVGLGRVMKVAAGDQNPGELFATLLRTFATTAHSERVGPLQFLEELETIHGTDHGQWDLDALPFKVTGVHNRVDLARDGSCGELRVSLASTHPLYQPFHAIFLFAQRPYEGDVSPGGRVHCGQTMRFWANLSLADPPEFLEAARTRLDEVLVPENFLILETVEFIISPWEWRQWLPTSDGGLENPPLFQTVDTARLNNAGPDRDAFLQFVSENAPALDARAVLLPERFRSPSARVNAGVPWIPLDLAGLDSDVLSSYPDLRSNIEIVGCPACHAADADFVQTRVDRTFSPFYDKELDARASYLRDAHQGYVLEVPFGPLQKDPILP